MADIGLDDVRGYWRDLAAPAYEEFWREYQKDEPVDRGRVLLIYRRMLGAALFLNHLADKAALRHDKEKGNHFMDVVQASDPALGASLHACRNLVNDVKHEAKLEQEATLRERLSGYDVEGVNNVLEINLLTKNSELHDMCLVIGNVFNFWIAYFDGSSSVNFRQTLV